MPGWGQLSALGPLMREWMRWLPLLWLTFVLGAAWMCRPQPVRRVVGAPPRESAPTHGWRALVVSASALVDLRLGVAVVIGLWIRSVAVRRRARVDEEAALVRTLPEVIDLLVLGVASGGSLYLAVRMVGDARLGPLAGAFGRTAADLDRGHLLAEALDRNLSPLGEPVRPLLRALLGADRYGSELAPTLVRLAREARTARRRRARAAAQRVPVRMLVPLVVAVLPAFVLLTVVPTLVRTFQGLQLGS